MGNFNCTAEDSSCSTAIGSLKLGNLASSCCSQVQNELKPLDNAVILAQKGLEDHIIQGITAIVTSEIAKLESRLNIQLADVIGTKPIIENNNVEVQI